MEILAPYLDVITLVLSLCSIVILLWGVVLSMKDFFVFQFTKTEEGEKFRWFSQIRNALGGYILLGLEVLIVADIIDSIVKPTFEDILRLAAIVAIRTVISHFLNKEISESKLSKEKTTEK